MIGRLTMLAATAGTAALFALAAAPAGAQTPPTKADVIFANAEIATMDDSNPTARAVAVGGGTILGVGRERDLQGFVGPNTKTVNMKGATMLPGFIDPHSHFLGYAFYLNPRWTDVSNVNVYFKPLPGDPRCVTPRDPQRCFIPVRTQDDVMARLNKAAAAEFAKPPAQRLGVFAFNYDASRLGHGSGCSGPATNVGFRCPNLENGKARETLNGVSNAFPVYVSGQSGHIAYANTKALQFLDICGVSGATAACYTPHTYPQKQLAMARDGQLVEDLALYADSKFDGLLAQGANGKPDPAVIAAIAQGINTYANHGYTLLQEGAATTGDAELYLELLKKDPKLPVTVALYIYDEKSGDFQDTITMARQTERLIANTPDLFIAGLKTFVDGGLPVYTADLKEPYKEVFPPFTGPLFEKPYTGLSDITRDALEQRIVAAHKAGYQLLIHELGDRSAERVAKAMTGADAEAPSRFRDVMLHGPLVSQPVLNQLQKLGRPISFLTQDLYFWGQPLCNQIMGAPLFERLPPYPANSAKQRGLTVTLHTDSPVTPPSPLFSIWVAKTRSVQQMPWYPNRNPKCGPVLAPQESLSIRHGIEAFTRDAAKQYGLLGERGTITPGKVADFVVLSDNPLAMEATPNRLKTVRVIGTVHDGNYRLNPLRDFPPIWPGDL